LSFRPAGRTLLIAALAAWFGTVGAPAEAADALLAATGRVIAILHGELFVGKAEGHLDGAGTLSIHSQKNPALTCLGEFVSSAALGGSGRLLCSDGAIATFSFKRLSIFRGFGTGSTSRGTLSFAYGFNAEQAAPYLQLPAGKKLEQNGTDLALVDLQETR
jgi:hypothetical protein